ncbi:hypothetical protein [Bacillus benzoevorans]|uniref:Septal ring factor EnvC (AmiA/AmiB activator) n=1 Tax=Bacillus benzoevorans TaxID=1456 RepID=A0A7X0HTA5_9BACI|nr:hypothetical protein [Bacillus benzoevorans]MBB6446469.1 septal ring factor EnvC (AmiA/AmiB activator) [Bacillus benzoevorans]
MFITKKEFNKLKKQVEEQEKYIQSMTMHMIQLEKELNELKRPQKTAYFG